MVEYFNNFGYIFKFEKKKPKTIPLFYLLSFIFHLYQSLDKMKIKIQNIISKTKHKIQFKALKIAYTTPELRYITFNVK